MHSHIYIYFVSVLLTTSPSCSLAFILLATYQLLHLWHNIRDGMWMLWSLQKSCHINKITLNW